MLPHPAFALSATASVNPTQYSGSCPATFTFKGTIIAPPSGTSVTYYFKYYDPGQQKYINVPTQPQTGTTTGGPGVLLVTPSTGSITGSGTGSVQLVVTVPAPGTTSPTMSFQVHCTNPQPSPTPSSSGSLHVRPPHISSPFALSVAPPSGLMSTLSAGVCATHGGLFCGTIVAAGLTLVWNWNPPCANCVGVQQVDGYKIYRVDNGNNSLITTLSNGSSQTVDGLPAPSGGFNGKCYAVTAYAGQQESTRSNTYCVGAIAGLQTTSLSASKAQSFYQNRVKTTSGPGSGLQDHGTLVGDSCQGGSPLCVGFSYSDETHWYGDEYWNGYTRLGLLFNIASLHANNLLSAKLTMTVRNTITGPDQLVVTNVSCIQTIEPADPGWLSPGAQWITGASDRALSAGVSGLPVSYDVTSIVKQWVAGSPNNGLVLIGPNEHLDAFTNASCSTSYLNPVLTVSYT